MNVQAFIGTSGLILSFTIAILLVKYMRHGKYKRLPIGTGDEDWFIAPAWVRLPPVALCGFAAVSILAVLFSFMRIDILYHLDKSMGGMSVVLCLVLYLIEHNAPKPPSVIRKRGSVAAAFCLGLALAIVLYSVVFATLKEGGV